MSNIELIDDKIGTASINLASMTDENEKADFKGFKELENVNKV